jgi:hypothetical protein
MPAGAPIARGANLPPSPPLRLLLLVLVRCWPRWRPRPVPRPPPPRLDPPRLLPPRLRPPPRDLPPLRTMSDGPRSQALFEGIDHCRCASSTMIASAAGYTHCVSTRTRRRRHEQCTSARVVPPSSVVPARAGDSRETPPRAIRSAQVRFQTRFLVTLLPSLASTSTGCGAVLTW